MLVVERESMAGKMSSLGGHCGGLCWGSDGGVNVAMLCEVITRSQVSKTAIVK